jgi:flagellin
MTVINTNIKSLVSQNAIVKNNRELSTAMQQLSTGKRINSAKDDAAGLAISSRMTAQIRGLDQAIRNSNDGISLLQTAEGSMIEITNMIQRMRELAVQSANDTNSVDDRRYLNLEFQQLKAEMHRVASMTEWNGKTILSHSSTNLGRFEFQVGAQANQVISIEIPDFTMNATVPTYISTSQRMNSQTFTLTGTNWENAEIYLSDGDYNYAVRMPSDIFSNYGSGGNYNDSIVDSQEASAYITNDFITSANQIADRYNLASSGNQIYITPSTSNENPVALRLLINRDQTQVEITQDILWANNTLTTNVTAADFNEAVPQYIGNSDGQLRILQNSEILTSNSASESLSVLDEALSRVNEGRANMGAVINRLTYAGDNLANVSQNTSESRSRIMDADYAKASSELARTQIISQAATAMLAQANQQPQTVLQLLQG